MERDKRKVIEAQLRALGVSCVTLGAQQMICAIALAYEQPHLLHNIVKELYPMVAKQFPGATGTSVERNLRNTRDQQWAKGDVDLLREMAGFQLKVKPTTGEFIDIICYYLDRSGLLEPRSLW